MLKINRTYRPIVQHFEQLLELRLERLFVYLNKNNYNCYEDSNAIYQFIYFKTSAEGIFIGTTTMKEKSKLEKKTLWNFKFTYIWEMDFVVLIKLRNRKQKLISFRFFRELNFIYRYQRSRGRRKRSITWKPCL